MWTSLRLCGKTELNCISEVRTKTGRRGRDKDWVQRFMFAKNGTKCRTAEADLELAHGSLQLVHFQKPGTPNRNVAEQGHADSEASAHWAASALPEPLPP